MEKKVENEVVTSVGVRHERFLACISSNEKTPRRIIRKAARLATRYNTSFVDENTELFIFPKTLDRGTRLLHYIADVTVNGYNNVGVQPKPEFAPLSLPKAFKGTLPTAPNRFWICRGRKGFPNGLWTRKKCCLRIPPSVTRTSRCLQPACAPTIC